MFLEGFLNIKNILTTAILNKSLIALYYLDKQEDNKNIVIELLIMQMEKC